jgi:hypothetical protein
MLRSLSGEGTPIQTVTGLMNTHFILHTKLKLQQLILAKKLNVSELNN